MSPEGDSHVARATQLVCQCVQQRPPRTHSQLDKLDFMPRGEEAAGRAQSEGVRTNVSGCHGLLGSGGGTEEASGSESISISLAFGQERDKEGEASVAKEQAVTHVSQEGAVRYSAGGTGTLVLSVFRRSDEAALLVSYRGLRIAVGAWPPGDG